MNPLDTIKNIINKGRSGVLFQSSNPLLRQQPKAPVFGIPRKPVIPVMPSTANTTRQTVKPIALQGPVVPPPPIDPLEIIRNGKNAVLRAPQGTEATASVRKNTPINRALFGSEQDRAAQLAAEQRGVKVPFTAKMTSGGILGTIAPSLARTPKERQEATSQALIEKGVDPDRAIEIAYYKDMSNGPALKTQAEITSTNEATKALKDLKLTPDEKNVLLKSKLFNAGESALDIGTFGVSGTVRNVGKGAIKTVLKGAELDIAEQAIDIARGTSKLDKEVQAEVMKKAQDIADREQFPNRVSGVKALANDFEAVLQNKPVKEKPVQPVGFKDSGELTTKVISRLEGKTNVSKQFIADLTKGADIKQPERELINRVLEREGKTVDVATFAERVQDELLPLQPSRVSQSYEGVNLPQQERGPVAKYTETVYESPIKTSAGQVHFSGRGIPTEAEINSGKSTGFPNRYFAHARREDLPNEQYLASLQGLKADISINIKDRANFDAGGVEGGTTRRILEIQSDLFQKGRLENEGQSTEDAEAILAAYRRTDPSMVKTGEYELEQAKLRASELSKLEPYRNTWHERVIREEVKKAAMDGKTKLQFPTGETAMKIEGLGQRDAWQIVPDGWSVSRPVSPNELTVGREISQERNGAGGLYEPWIITDVLGDGKFKAVPKRGMEIDNDYDYDLYKYAERRGLLNDDSGVDIERALKNEAFMLQYAKKYGEQFDISGKVDQNNPIYKFYEKEMSKYLKNKYGATLVADKQGVTWYEVAVKSEYANKPVEAFAGGVVGVEEDEEGNTTFDPIKTALGIAGVGAVGSLSRKSFSKIDQLIAANKVRVVSRNGRDVYQVKKGGQWVSKRNEDSAIRAVTPKNPIDVIKTAKTPKVVRAEATYKATPGQVKDYESKLTTLSGAEAGERLAKNNPDGTFGGYVGKSSTFPSYVNEDLRSRKLFDRYLDGRDGTANDFNITYPKGSKLARLDKIIKDQVGVKETKIPQMSRARAIPVWEKNAIEQATREERQIVKQTEPQFRSVLETPTPVPKAQVAGLEKASRPSIDAVRPSTPYKVDSLQDIITKTPLEKKVNIVDYLRTPDRVLNKIGFGKEAVLLRSQFEKYSQELPKNIDKITDWVNRVPAKSSERIFQYLDGKEIKLSAEELKVADEIKVYLKDWADRLGLPEENRVANYITRLFDDQLIKQEFDEDLAKIISGKIPGEVYNPFLQKRLGAKGYKQDVWGALDAYTKRATRKVHIDQVLERIRDKAGASLEFTNLEESQFKYIQRYIDRVQMRPTEVDNAIDNAVKQTLGYRFGQRPVTTISRFLRRMTYRGMLGGNLGSALRNLSQGVNTYAVLGEKYTVIGYSKLLQPAARKELLEQGIFNNNFIEDRVLSSTRKILQKGDKALWFFFDQAEKTNRGAAYLGAKAKGLGQGMSEQEAIDYAKSVVRRTQFNYDAIDQPVALGSDIVKTFLQFQTYTTKQTEFLAEIVKGAAKGDKKMQNVISLLRYGIAGYAFVNTVGKALGMSMGEMIPLYQNLTGERELSAAPSLKLPIEVVKAAANTPDKYGNDRDLEQKMKDIGKSTIGLIPGGNQVKKTVEGIEAVEKGGSFDKAGKLQFEQGTSTASKVQSILFGKYSSQKAKDYFNKKTGSTGDKELDAVLKADKETQAATTEKVTTEIMELSKLTPDEQKARLQEIAQTDKDYAIKLRDKLRVENKKKTWSEVDKGINKLGVENGARADYVYKKMKELPADQRNSYIKDLRERKVISDDVYEQIKKLHKNRDIM